MLLGRFGWARLGLSLGFSTLLLLLLPSLGLLSGLGVFGWIQGCRLRVVLMFLVNLTIDISSPVATAPATQPTLTARLRLPVFPAHFALVCHSSVIFARLFGWLGGFDQFFIRFYLLPLLSQAWFCVVTRLSRLALVRRVGSSVTRTFCLLFYFFCIFWLEWSFA